VLEEVLLLAVSWYASLLPCTVKQVLTRSIVYILLHVYHVSDNFRHGLVLSLLSIALRMSISVSSSYLG